jgi:hypothetical protein
MFLRFNSLSETTMGFFQMVTILFHYSSHFIYRQIINTMNFLFYSGILSLFIQILTGIFDVYVLTFSHDEHYHLIRELLKIELYVQVIEGAFYVWLVTNFYSIKNITPARYYDWIITTPTMLFTYCVYLLHLKRDGIKDKNTDGVLEIIQKNTPNLVPIFILNTLMLMFGYLVERGVLSVIYGVSLGFIPFFIMFYLIYENYAKFTDIGIQTFWYFSIIWGIYGLAALAPYKIKNIMYNILDLFSKNFFGIFLAAILYVNRL